MQLGTNVPTPSIHLRFYLSKIKETITLNIIPKSLLSGKLSCNWLIMLVTMGTPISSHVKDKNSIFTARDEDMIFQ